MKKCRFCTIGLKLMTKYNFKTIKKGNFKFYTLSHQHLFKILKINFWKKSSKAIKKNFLSKNYDFLSKSIWINYLLFMTYIYLTFKCKMKKIFLIWYWNEINIKMNQSICIKEHLAKNCPSWISEFRPYKILFFSSATYFNISKSSYFLISFSIVIKTLWIVFTIS